MGRLFARRSAINLMPHFVSVSSRMFRQRLIERCCKTCAMQFVLAEFVAVEARNALFALFTLNRYSRAFFRDALLDEQGLRSRSGDEAETLDAALGELDARFRLDLPAVRKGYDNEPGYDEVLSRTHVPMELERIARDVGLIETRLLFYHYHALPPMLEARVPNLFRRESLKMENPMDWRGYVMASAFILVGRKAD